MMQQMARKKDNPNFAPRTENRRALHDYTILARMECGIALTGSEVKSLRQGKAQLQDSFARIDGKQLVLHKCHIDPYDKATLAWNHDPKRDRILLVHKRELIKLRNETEVPGVTLVPLAIYFKDGFAKVELAVAKGKQYGDKRAAIKKKEQDREVRRAMTVRR